MSFFDGMVNAAKHVFGFDRDEPAKPRIGAERPRGAVLASDVATGFDREPSRSARRAVPAFQALAPHVTGARGETPPTDLATPRARVFDAPSGRALGTVDELAGVDAASVGARNVQTGLDYFARAFGRNGLDGAGAGVDVRVNDRTRDATGTEIFAGNGGYYASRQADGSISEAIHFGSGTSYSAERGLVDQREMQYADDLTIHELVHGVIRKESGHLGGDANEAGATNEAIADVMAAAATRDWRIGEGMYTSASDYKLMRNIGAPTDPTAVHGLWTSMDEVRANQQRTGEIEEHWASGVLSTAAYRMQQRLGGEQGWQAVEQVFYRTIDANMLGDMSFTAVAQALRLAAAQTYGAGSGPAVVVDEELRRAGL